MTLDDVTGGDTRTYPYSVPENYVYTNPQNPNPIAHNGDLWAPYTNLRDGWADVPDGGTLWLKSGEAYSPSSSTVVLNGRDKAVALKYYN